MQVTVKLTLQEATALVAAAAPAIRFWAIGYVPRWGATKLEVTPRDAADLDVIPRCERTGTRWTVTTADLERGLGLAISLGLEAVTERLCSPQGVMYLDQAACDIVVQLAIFGEVRT